MDVQSGATTMLELLSSGQQTAASLLEGLADARASAGALNALLPVSLNAPAQALASDRRRTEGAAGLLEGLPVSVKDNVALDGAPTTGSSPQLADYILAEGQVIARLRAAGTVFTDKTNLHELAFGITGENAFTGPARNPFDRARLAGGSSSGAAVAVATGACAVAIGTDTGGSCRIPAAHCGVVGFRPTTGRYPDDGYLVLSPSRDTLGILARTVADIALVDGVITAETQPAPSIDIQNSTLGIVHPDPVDPAVAQAFEATLEKLRAAGVRLVPVSFSEVLAADAQCGFVIALFETARSMEGLARRALDTDLATFSAGIAGADVRHLIGGQVGEGAIPEAVYLEARHVHLPRLRAAMAQALAGVDALIYPTTPLTAPDLEPGDMANVNGVSIPLFPAYSMLTAADSMAGVPSISLAGGLADGMPTGVQLTGASGSDRRLLAIAAAIEAMLPPRPVIG